MQDTKKVAGELLVELEKKGVTFETVDGKLKYKDSKGNFTESSKEKVKKYKEEIIEILKKKQTIDEFITDNDYETNVYPLTDVQAAYLVGKTEAVKWGGIGCKGYIEVDFGSYSAEELSRAWKVLVNRHEMLRAKVTEVGFEILERDEIDYEIKIVNLQKMAEREKVDTLSKIREDFSEYVFHTEEPPLFKVLITKRIAPCSFSPRGYRKFTDPAGDLCCYVLCGLETGSYVFGLYPDQPALHGHYVLCWNEAHGSLLSVCTENEQHDH